MTALVNPFDFERGSLTPISDHDLSGTSLPDGLLLNRSSGHASGKNSSDEYFIVTTNDTPVFSKGFAGGSSRELMLRAGASGFAINQTGAGAVVGTPGTFPTGWEKIDSGGLTWKVYEVGSRNGMPGVGLQLSGTSGGSGNRQMKFCTHGLIPVIQGQSITFSLFIQRDITADPRVTWVMDIVYCDAAGVETSSSADYVIVPAVGGNLTECRFQVPQYFSTSSVISVKLRLMALIASAGTINEKVFVSMPQADRGAFASDPLGLTGTAADRNDETLSVLTGEAANFDLLVTSQGVDTWLLNQPADDITGITLSKLPNGATSLSRLRVYRSGVLSSTKRRALVDDVLPTPVLSLHADTGVTLGDGNTVSAWTSSAGSGVATQATLGLRPSQVDFLGIKFLEVSSGDVMDLTGVSYPNPDDITVITVGLPAGNSRMTLLGCENAASVQQIEYNSRGAGTIGSIVSGTYVMTSQALPVENKPSVVCQTKKGNYCRIDINGEMDVELYAEPLLTTYAAPGALKLFRRALGSQQFAGIFAVHDVYSPALTQAQADHACRDLIQKYRFTLRPTYENLHATQYGSEVGPGFEIAVDLPDTTPAKMAISTTINFSNVVAEIDAYQHLDVECADTTRRYPAKYSFRAAQGALHETNYWYAPVINGVVDIARANKIRTNPSLGSTIAWGLGFHSCVKAVSSPLIALAAVLACTTPLGISPLFQIFCGDFGYPDGRIASSARTDVKQHRQLGYRFTLATPGISTARQAGGMEIERDDHDTRNDPLLSQGPHIALENAAFAQAYIENIANKGFWDTQSPPRTLSRAFTVGRVRFIVLDTSSQATDDGDEPTMLGTATNPPNGHDQYSRALSELTLYSNDPNIDYIAFVSPSGFPSAVHRGWREVAPLEFERIMEHIRNLNGRAVVLGLTGDFHSVQCYSHIDYSTGGGAQMPTFLISPLWSTVITQAWAEYAEQGNWCGNTGASWYGPGQMASYIEFQGEHFKVEVWGKTLTKPYVYERKATFTDLGYALGPGTSLTPTPRTISFDDLAPVVATGEPFTLRLHRGGLPPVDGCTVDYTVAGHSDPAQNGTFQCKISSTQQWKDTVIPSSTTDATITLSNFVRCVAGTTSINVDFTA